VRKIYKIRVLYIATQLNYYYGKTQ